MTAVGIVGLGHIGGSLALALRDAGIDVVATSNTASTRDEAAADGLVVVDTVDAVAEQADVIVVAAALHVIDGVVLDAIRAADRRTEPPTVTDAGSVKAPIAARVRDDAQRPDLFVPGHPMAGNEGSGFGSAVPDLFRGRTWALTPDAEVGLDRWAAVARVAIAVGATVVPVAPDEHDDAVALTSHLSYVLAALVAGRVGEEDHAGLVRSLAAGSYASLTRVAGGHERLGADMALANREAVVRRIRDLTDGLTGLADALAQVIDPGDVSHIDPPGRTIFDVFESGSRSKRAEAVVDRAPVELDLDVDGLLDLGRRGGRVLEVLAAEAGSVQVTALDPGATS